MSSTLLDAKTIAPHLGQKDAAAVRRLARKRIIPVIKIGYRQHRFDLDKCKAALAKLEVKSI